MFAYIKGSLEVKTNGYIVIDVNGIGYKIFMSETAINKLGAIGEIIKIHTYVRVREDDISIYGFNTNEELRMFELLLSVSGIGAKSALVILSNVSVSSFALAIINNDINLLKKLPGIGPKTAQRVILELKDKLKKENEIVANENTDISDTINTAIMDDEKIAEEQVVGVLNFDIHLVKDFKGKRYIERITECIPLENEDNYNLDYKKAKTGDAKLDKFFDNATIYFSKSTNLQTYKYVNILEYHDGNYVLTNPISEINRKEMKNNMDEQDAKKFEQFCKENWN